MLSRKELEEHFSSTLGCRILLSLCFDEIAEEALSKNEKLKFAEMKHEARRSSWLRGRKALKQILAQAGHELGENAKHAQADLDTTKLEIPHPRLSLSHSAELAVAAACLDEVNGVGVDLEAKREVRDGVIRFFLQDAEKNTLEKMPEPGRADSLLRLWTVKESLFKADTNNQGMTLLKYAVDDAVTLVGTGYRCMSETQLNFKYSSLKIDDYWLTVALAHGGKEI